MSSFDGKFLIGLTLLFFTMVNANEEVSTAFSEHQVVPDVIPNPPTNFLKVTYDDEYLTVNKGNELTPTQVKKQPKIEYEAEESAHYTLIMTDPDAPSRENPKFREFKHWVVVNIPGNNIDQGEVLSAYVGSGPPKDTGLHRYVFLLYKQPKKLEFTEKRVGNNSRAERPKFRAAEFAKKYELGDPISGNFYQAQYDNYVPTLHAQLSEN